MKPVLDLSNAAKTSSRRHILRTPRTCSAFMYRLSACCLLSASCSGIGEAPARVVYFFLVESGGELPWPVTSSVRLTVEARPIPVLTVYTSGPPRSILGDADRTLFRFATSRSSLPHATLTSAGSGQSGCGGSWGSCDMVPLAGGTLSTTSLARESRPVRESARDDATDSPRICIGRCCVGCSRTAAQNCRSKRNWHMPRQHSSLPSGSSVKLTSPACVRVAERACAAARSPKHCTTMLTTLWTTDNGC